MLSLRAKYYFSITKWTETGGDEYEYEVEMSRIKGGEGGSKKFVVAIGRLLERSWVPEVAHDKQ